MIPPLRPADEAVRLAALHRLRLLDTDPEARFDRYVRIARRVFDVPIAAVSLIDRDRQWFKARSGLDAEETSRDTSFCGHTILGLRPMVVADATEDPRFSDNPLVRDAPHVRFYAGVPLALPEGQVVGTQCVFDHRARELVGDDLEMLVDLGALVAGELAQELTTTTDPTTGLADRAGFDCAAQSLIATCRQHRQPAVLLHVALDLLELIDESQGHSEGEHALAEMAEILRATFRQGDLIARIGDGHFCILCPGADLAAVRALITRLERRIEAANVLRSGRWPLTFRVSHAVWAPTDDADWVELLATAQPQGPRLGNTPAPRARR